MKTRKVDGVVIDMRGNGGGYLGDAVAMNGALIDRGPVVQIEDAKGRREVLSDDEPGTSYDGPVVLLADRFSASATAIVAGTLQDYGRAVVVSAAGAPLDPFDAGSGAVMDASLRWRGDSAEESCAEGDSNPHGVTH